MHELNIDQSHNRTVNGYHEDIATSVKFIVRRTAEEKLAIICQTSPEAKDFHRAYKPNVVQREMIDSFWVHFRNELMPVDGVEIDGIFVMIKPVSSAGRTTKVGEVLQAFDQAISEVERFQLAHMKLNKGMSPENK